MGMYGGVAKIMTRFGGTLKLRGPYSNRDSERDQSFDNLNTIQAMKQLSESLSPEP